MIPLQQHLNKYKGNRVAVMWSGGADSTALVCGLVRADAKVTLLEVDTYHIPNYEKEVEVRALAREWFKANGFDVKHVVFKTSGMVGTHPAVYVQSSWWLAVAMLAATSAFDYIAMGWVAGDESSAILDKYLNVWNAYKELWSPDKQGSELTFPMAQYDKWHITQLLSSVGKPPVWWCETNNDTPCGKCPSCLDAYDKGQFALYDIRHPYFDKEEKQYE